MVIEKESDEDRRKRFEPYIKIERMVDEAIIDAVEAATNCLRKLNAPIHVRVSLISDIKTLGEIWKNGISAGGRAMVLAKEEE